MADGVGRRGLLRAGALGAGAVAAGVVLERLSSHRDGGPPASPEAPSSDAGAPHYDFAIVGGGVSGIYCGWRLLSCDGSPPIGGGQTPPKVALFEKSIHVLGRIRSVRLDKTDRPGELGAMRYMPKRQPLVRLLVEDKLGLPTREFAVSGENNLFYARGKRLTNREVAKTPAVLPYFLWSSERGKTPDELALAALSALVPGALELSESAWDELRRDGTMTVHDPRDSGAKRVPLHQVGLANAFGYVMSREAFHLITDAGGYDSATFNYNAVEGLHDIAEEAGADVTYRTPVDGMAAIPNALRAQFEASGGEVHLQHVLRTVAYEAAKRLFVLTFDVAALTVLAHNVILAMPPASLRRIVHASPLFDSERMSRLMSAVTPVPMTRVLSSYESAWWTSLGIESGRTISDLPLRQLYYFGAAQESRPFVMAYTDGVGDDYFAGYQHPEDADAPKHLDPSSALLQELRVQMSEIHGREAPLPLQSFVKHWSSDTYGGAYHLWNPGVHTRDVAAKILQPLVPEAGQEALPLYVCGEAFSHSQGWVQGALTTAEDVLAKLGKDPLSAGRVAIPFAPQAPLECLTCHARTGG